ncbi:signal peptidase-like protein I [Mollisia scopiformis]|uniref:Signal peptidase-like protein I n=1 Tax=Mollisia scopiformis TaxID=149040 RepID=A0A194XQK1_MOLSC|nr:signal peptidase-like protein I [Mollisia scopiformis]KUJ21997.1 signal peptidase-like protein I [Mollisia scopiformis]
MTVFQRLSRPFNYLRDKYVGHPFLLVGATLKTLFVSHVFLEYGFTMGACEGASMLPTLEVYGDSVLISKAYRRGRGIKVGDVVQFDSVVEPGSQVIKTVLGLEGDYVLRDSPGTSGQMIQVPRGHCWVVGDNLDFSRDSRMFGPMPMALIKGKVIAKVLPWSERKWLINELKHVQ